MKSIETAALAVAVALTPVAAPISAAMTEVDKKAVLKTYADTAHAGYEDSLVTAVAL